MSVSSNECLICFEELDKYHVAILNCPHIYHLCCIQKWNKKSKNYSIVCPQCNINGEIINIEVKESSRPNSPLLPHSKDIIINNENNHCLVARDREQRESREQRENRERIRRQQGRIRLNRNNNRNNSNNRNNQNENKPFYCCNIL